MPLAPIPLSTVEQIGQGLHRPEDVVVGRDGRVFASGHEFGAVEIMEGGAGLRPVGPAGEGAANGLNMDRDGAIIIANFGLHNGGPGPLERLDPATGVREHLLTEVEGRRLVASNYPVVDRAGNIWCSHSTYCENFTAAARGNVHDGMIYVLRPDGSSSIAAEGLSFANGLAMSADERFLFCAQTLGSDVVRLPILEGQRLGPVERYGPQLGAIFDPDGPIVRRDLGCTDGIGFDVEGNLWVTVVHANKIVAITPQREVVTILDDPDGGVMDYPTNVTWGGADMRDLYIGMLGHPYVLKVRSPVAGQRLVHQF